MNGRCQMRGDPILTTNKSPIGNHSSEGMAIDSPRLIKPMDVSKDPSLIRNAAIDLHDQSSNIEETLHKIIKKEKLAKESAHRQRQLMLEELQRINIETSLKDKELKRLTIDNIDLVAQITSLQESLDVMTKSNIALEKRVQESDRLFADLKEESTAKVDYLRNKVGDISEQLELREKETRRFKEEVKRKKLETDDLLKEIQFRDQELKEITSKVEEEKKQKEDDLIRQQKEEKMKKNQLYVLKDLQARFTFKQVAISVIAIVKLFRAFRSDNLSSLGMIGLRIAAVRDVMRQTEIDHMSLEEEIARRAVGINVSKPVNDIFRKIQRNVNKHLLETLYQVRYLISSLDLDWEKGEGVNRSKWGGVRGKVTRLTDWRKSNRQLYRLPSESGSVREMVQQEVEQVVNIREATLLDLRRLEGQISSLKEFVLLAGKSGEAANTVMDAVKLISMRTNSLISVRLDKGIQCRIADKGEAKLIDSPPKLTKQSSKAVVDLYDRLY